MKLVFSKTHTHRGVKYYPGQELDASDNDSVTLISRGVAEKVKPAARPRPKFESKTVGEADDPASDE